MSKVHSVSDHTGRSPQVRIRIDKARASWQHKQDLKVQRVNVRQKLRANLTPDQQIRALDVRLGRGVGARAERARLNDLLEVKKLKSAVSSLTGVSVPELDKLGGFKKKRARRVSLKEPQLV